LDVDSEILCIIATELGNMIPFIGGHEYYKNIMEILELLCLGDEFFVAEKVFPFKEFIFKIYKLNIRQWHHYLL
jgi:hypothetical protein